MDVKVAIFEEGKGYWEPTIITSREWRRRSPGAFGLQQMDDVPVMVRVVEREVLGHQLLFAMSPQSNAIRPVIMALSNSPTVR